MNKARLIKILTLTSSDSDGEALSAIRKANEMIKASGITWGQLLSDETATVKQRPHRSPEPQKPSGPSKETVSFFINTIMSDNIWLGTISPREKAWVLQIVTWYTVSGIMATPDWETLKSLYYRRNR